MITDYNYKTTVRAYLAGAKFGGELILKQMQLKRNFTVEEIEMHTSNEMKRFFETLEDEKI